MLIGVDSWFHEVGTELPGLVTELLGNYLELLPAVIQCSYFGWRDCLRLILRAK